MADTTQPGWLHDANKVLPQKYFSIENAVKHSLVYNFVSVGVFLESLSKILSHSTGKVSL